jgi:hypothetical protein
MASSQLQNCCTLLGSSKEGCTMILSPEAEFRLRQIALEAEELDAPQLRKVLVRTWQLWLTERQTLREALAAEGIAMNVEVNGAHPKQLAASLG